MATRNLRIIINHQHLIDGVWEYGEKYETEFPVNDPQIIVPYINLNLKVGKASIDDLIIDDGDYIKLELNIPKFKIYQLDETSRFILYYIYTYEGAFDEKTLDGYHLKISQIRKHQESYDAKIQEKIINCPIILNAMILLNLVNANLYVIDVDPINENVTIQVGESRLIGTKGACSLNENAIFRNFSLGGNTEESFYQTTTSVVVSLVKD